MAGDSDEFEKGIDKKGVVPVNSTTPGTPPPVNPQTPPPPAPQSPTIDDVMALLLEERAARKLLEERIAMNPQGGQQIDLEAVGKMIKAMREDNPLNLPEEADDPADYDEHGTPFYAFQYYLPIADDIRNGKIVFPPKAGTNSSRIIEFMPDSGKRVRNGRQEDVINICKFVSKSHKLTEWMKKDKRFNTLYFETLPQITQGTALFAKRMMQILAWTTTQPAGALVKKCEELNLIPSTDVDQMRNNVAMKMAEAEFHKNADGAWIPNSLNKSTTERMFNDEAKEDLLATKEARRKMHGDNPAFVGEKMDIVKVP
jgi:hypothetical protein